MVRVEMALRVPRRVSVQPIISNEDCFSFDIGVVFNDIVKAFSDDRIFEFPFQEESG